MELGRYHTRGVWLRVIFEHAHNLNYIDSIGQKNLEDRFGKSGISSLKTYSFDDEIFFYQNVVYRHIFTRNQKMPFYEVGYENYMAYASSSLGKTSLLLFKYNWRPFALNCGPVIMAMASGFTIKTESLDNSQIVVSIFDCPYDVSYFGGIYNSAVKSLTKEVYIVWNVLDEHNFRYDFIPYKVSPEYSPKQGFLAPVYEPGKI